MELSASGEQRFANFSTDQRLGQAISGLPEGACPLEIEGNLRRQRTRGYVVRSTEGGEEVVERELVSDIDGR